MNSPIYATTKCSNRSAKYNFISTACLLDDLKSRGWNVVKIQVSRIIKNAEVREGFQKHGVTLQHDTLPSVGGIFPRIILTNSHDGTSSFQFRLGLFRVVCSNGLVVSAGHDSVYRIRHTNVSPYEIDKAIDFIMQTFERTVERVRYFQSKTITIEQAVDFATRAYQARFGDRVLFDPARLLDIRRTEDCEPTLWNVLNIIQENAIKGGQQYSLTNARKKKYNTTREIKGIDANIRVNSNLWEIAESMAA